MINECRVTGIDAVGDVLWGTHICHLYRTKEDLIDILVPYFRSGLQHNELCLWVTSEPLLAEEAVALLKKAAGSLDYYINKGQIEMLKSDEWYISTGEFNSGNVFSRLLDKEHWAVKRGFDGLRVSGNVSWLEYKDYEKFMDYEASVSHVVTKHRTIAICSYPLDKYGVPELVDLVTNHEFILLRRSHAWELIDNSRYKRVFNLRRSGLNYADIGRKLDLTRERVRQIVTRQGKINRRISRHDDNLLLTVGEAAEIIRVHPNTIRRWSNEGTIKAYCIGSRGDRRFRRRDLDDLLGKLTSTGMKRLRKHEEKLSTSR